MCKLIGLHPKRKVSKIILSDTGAPGGVDIDRSLTGR